MNFANKISLFRILSVPFFIAAMIYYSADKLFLRWVALVIFVLASVSDAVDGYIARKSRQQSKAGLVLDPLGDKLLLMSAFLCLTLNSYLEIRFPLWVTLIIISRDILILAGALIIYLVKQSIIMIPNRWGKFSTLFQVLAVLVVLLQAKIQIAAFFWTVAVIFTLLSAIIYINRGFKVLYG